jgi:hypothetical protein
LADIPFFESTPMLSIRSLILSMSLFTAAHALLDAQTAAEGSESHFKEIYTYTREKVDVKQKLNNGAYYENPYYNAIGHPFLNDGNFQNGAVVFRNSTFDHVRLKYDIFHQQLLISPDPGDPMLMILLANDFVSTFWIGDSCFRKSSLTGADNTFFQVLLEEEHIILYRAWSKMRYKSFDDGENMRYRFSGRKQRDLLEVHGKMSNFSNNSSFLSLFSDSEKSQIKTYLKSNKIKVNKSSDNAIKEVVRYCESILTQNEQILTPGLIQ